MHPGLLEFSEDRSQPENRRCENDGKRTANEILDAAVAIQICSEDMQRSYDEIPASLIVLLAKSHAELTELVRDHIVAQYKAERKTD